MYWFPFASRRGGNSFCSQEFGTLKNDCIFKVFYERIFLPLRHSLFVASQNPTHTFVPKTARRHVESLLGLPGMESAEFEPNFLLI